MIVDNFSPQLRPWRGSLIQILVKHALGVLTVINPLFYNCLRGTRFCLYDQAAVA